MKKYIIMVLLFAAMSCAERKVTSIEQVMSTEPFIIYKTKADYNHNVPVVLNADKSFIVSYPGPQDLFVGDKFSTPTKLAKGFLLDNRGITLNVAFTSYTYAEYVKFDKAPSINDLFDSIIDSDPILEMYNCQNQLQIKNNTSKMNKLIRRGFKGCSKIK